MSPRAGRGGRPPANLNLKKKMLVGMVHLPPLPGSPRAGAAMPDIVERAVNEARLLADAGFDAVMVENFGDAPFVAECVGSETVAAMAIVTEHVVRAVRIPVGVNVLRNDGMAALSIAAVAGAVFVRVNVLSGVYATDQGFIAGRSREVLNLRARLAPHVKIAADVHVKHATPISQPDLALAAEETAHRAGADVLIVSGTGTGKATDLDSVRTVAAAVPDVAVWIGSGMTSKTARQCAAIASGAIVGTALKRGGRTTAPLDRQRVLVMRRSFRN